jgi:LPXTG-motif cell wall-anchored protein
VTAAAGMALAAGLFTAPAASAHTPQWNVDCSSVSVNLTAYNDSVTNTVNIKVDGDDLLPVEEFGSSFSKRLDLPEHTTPAEVRLIVVAGDGDRYSVDETKTSHVCEEPPAPAPDEPGEDLAETGSSPATPAIAGAAGGVLLLGAAILAVTRKRRPARR